MAQEAVVDTTVLRRANVPLTGSRAEATLLKKRLTLLERIQRRAILVLLSSQLLNEYADQIKGRNNDYIKAFFELLVTPERVIWNWKKSWSGGERERARQCRFPSEDFKVLRTAIRANPSVIFSEEQRMLAADKCIYRQFRVHIYPP